MASRTLQTMVASVVRKCGGQVLAQEAAQALYDANITIYGKWEWPWEYKEANIAINPTYTTGTIDVTNGSTTVTGTGTSWDTNWRYKKLYFGNDNVDHPVAQVNSTTSITLEQAPNIAANLTGSTYTIYQDVYPLPTDCDAASDLMIVNLTYRYRFKKFPRYTLEASSIYSRIFFSNYQVAYSDAGFDPTNRVYLIRMVPIPSATAEYRIIYRKKAPDLAALADRPEIPSTYDQALEFMAEAELRRHKGMNGWREAKQEGYQLLVGMRRRFETQMLDIYSRYRGFPEYEGTSVYADNMFIDPVP